MSWPSSFIVGTSGCAGERLPPNEASARALPALSWPLAAEIDDTSACELLPISAISAGPPPAVGKWRSWMPADFMNNAIGRGSAPYNPDERKINALGGLLGSPMETFNAVGR